MAVRTAVLPLHILTVGDVMVTEGAEAFIPVTSALVFVIVPVADNVCVDVLTELPVTFIHGSEELYAPKTILASVPVTSPAA